VRRVVVITGATAGVGPATSRLFAEHGWDVALLARGSAGLAAATAEIPDRGQRSIAIPVDVADFAAVEAAAERVEKTLGPIDVWVNDAMTTVFAQVDEIDPPDFERAIDVTFLGQVWGTKAALARMKPATEGRSSMWDRRSPSSASLCRAPTVPPNSLAGDSSRRPGRSSSTNIATS